jgi:hypothetical protein
VGVNSRANHGAGHHDGRMTLIRGNTSTLQETDFHASDDERPMEIARSVLAMPSSAARAARSHLLSNVAMIVARRSGVISGITPNQDWKAGRA